MKTSRSTILKSASLAASLLVLSPLLTGCGPEQDDQFNAAIPTPDYRTSPLAPHLHTGLSEGYFLSNLPAGDRHRPHALKAPQLRHHSAQTPQLGPAAVN